MCYSEKIIIAQMMAEFHLASSVSIFLYCACSLTVMTYWTLE